MGLYQRKNGMFYISFYVDGRRVRNSLNTKNKHLADELYAIFLKEKFLKSTLLQLGTSSNITDTQTTEKPKQESKSFHSYYLKYLEHCKTLNLSKRTVEQKERLLKVFKSHKIDSFNNLNNKMLGRLLCSI